MIINKNIKGITLIALIITIIVLLILAGVTLSSLFGQDSIIGKAKEAADKWNNAIDDENEYFSHFGEESSEQEEKEEPIVETNPDFFTYSNPDRNDEVFITGFTTGKNGNAEGINYNTSSSYINYYQYTPWYISREKNPKIIIENGITKIGNNTFLGSENSQYYYTGSSSEWTQVTGTGGINISSSNFNYSE